MKKSIATLALALVIASGAFAQTVETYLQGHTESVNAVVYSPDGRRAATASRDNTVKIWDTASGRETITLAGHSDSVYAIAYSPDGSQLASGSDDDTVKVWNPATGAEIRTLSGHENNVRAVAFSPDGSRIASYSSDKSIKLWDAASGRLIRTISGLNNGGTYSIAFSPDGRRLLSGEREAVRIWDANTGSEIRNIANAGASLSIRAVYSPDGKQIAANAATGIIKIWNAETGVEVKTFSTTDVGAVFSLTYSSDGRRILAGYGGNIIKIWDVETGREIRTLTGHTDSIRSVAYSPDGTRILSGSWDYTARIWDAATGRELLSLAKNTVPVYRVALSPNGKRLASGSSDGIIRIWDIENGRMLQAITAHVFNGSNVPVFSLVYSADGRRLLSGGDDDTVKIWDAETGRNIRTIATGAGSAFCASYSPDGKRILSGLQDKVLKIWDAESGRELRTLTGHTNMVWAAAWSPDGKRVVSGSDDKSVKLWDAETGKEIRTMSNNAHGGRVNMLAFSPAGNEIVSCGANKSIVLWNAETGAGLTYQNDISALSFVYSRDGNSILVGFEDGSIDDYYYHIDALSAHTSAVNHAVFSTDSKLFASASSDGTLRLWNTEKRVEIAQFIGFAGNEWICLIPSSYYTASAKGDQMVNARSGNTVSGLDRYRSTYNNDAIVAAVLTLSGAGSNSSGVFSFTTLPPANAKAATAMLGAIAYKDGQATRFLEPANREKISRYEAALQALKTKTGITDTEVQNALRTAISAEVDAQFNRVEFMVNTNTDGANVTLTRKQGQYILKCDGYWGNPKTEMEKEFSGASLDALLTTMRNSGDFSEKAYGEVRAQAALIPALTGIGKLIATPLKRFLTEFFTSSDPNYQKTLYRAIPALHTYCMVLYSSGTTDALRVRDALIASLESIDVTLAANVAYEIKQINPNGLAQRVKNVDVNDLNSLMQLMPQQR